MTGIDKFIDIFGGSFSAYGQTRKTDEFDDRGKHKTKSFYNKENPKHKNVSRPFRWSRSCVRVSYQSTNKTNVDGHV